MFKNISTILIWSSNYKPLADWYQQTFNFPIIEELNHPQDTGVLFDAGSVSLWIGQHSQVTGQNPDPHRHMFNLDVESVTQTYQHLQSQGITFIAKPFKAPTFDKYFATFSDPDGNLIQLIGNQ